MPLRTAVAVSSRLDKGGLPAVDNIDMRRSGARTGSRIMAQLLTKPQLILGDLCAGCDPQATGA